MSMDEFKRKSSTEVLIYKNDDVIERVNVLNAIIENEQSKAKLIAWKEQHKIKKARNTVKEELGGFVKMFVYMTKKLVMDRDIKELDFKILFTIVCEYAENDNFEATLKTQQEYAEQLLFSLVAVQKSFKKLEKKGYLIKIKYGNHNRYKPNPLHFFKSDAMEQLQELDKMKKEREDFILSKIRSI